MELNRKQIVANAAPTGSSGILGSMPERAMTSPGSLLNSKECHSGKAIFINVYV